MSSDKLAKIRSREGPMADVEIAAKVRLRIPATFYADVLVGPNGEARIEGFFVTPLEAGAGYFGPTAEPEDCEVLMADVIPDVAENAAVAYWQRTNVDGDWPVDTVKWVE